MQKILWVLVILAGLLCDGEARGAAETPRDYRFDGSISRPVLENYLARAITESDLLNGKGNTEDNIRMLTNVGAKFIGRALITWGNEDALPGLFAQAPAIIGKLHAADPDIIVQGTAFEIVTRRVEQLPVPEWVFKEFGLPAERRNFRYDAMLYPSGLFKGHWGRSGSVPDMNQLETRMWFFYLAASSINAGIEAIHFGQVELMDKRDKDHACWSEMLTRVRAYAKGHARRHMLLCDAHVPSGGILREGNLLFDFHSFPLRIDEVVEKPIQGVLKVGYLDSLFGRSKGGLTPSGWSCEHLPFLVELDNFGSSRREGQNIGQHWIWGYDEISWFAHLGEPERNAWLRYATDWIRKHDANGHLEMPGSRQLAAPVDGKRWYYANTPSTACPDGFGQEETIKALWGGEQ